MSRIPKIIQEYDNLKNEVSILQQKLSGKCEALMILSKDLHQCRQERDQFKLMAEQVQSRYQALKRQLAGIEPQGNSNEFGGSSQSLSHLLAEMRDVNKGLQLNVDDYKQKLNDAHGDIKLLREQLIRQRVGASDEGLNMRLFPAHERESLVKQIEEEHIKYSQLERDLEQVLDQKEEYETERDAYRSKYERLNQEMNYILKGDENRVMDVDAIIMENKYLQERIKQMEEENDAAMATVSKYKTMLGKKKTKGIMKTTQNKRAGMVVSQKQVKQLLETSANMPPTIQLVTELQSLCTGLLDTVNDKNLALSHQRKTNKILGSRVSDLEKKLRTLEVGGLWTIANKGSDANTLSLENLKLECSDMRNTLVQPTESPTSPENCTLPEGDFSLEDLDQLPTKDTAPWNHINSDDSSASATPVDATTPNESPLDTPSGPLSPQHQLLLSAATANSTGHFLDSNSDKQLESRTINDTEENSTIDTVSKFPKEVLQELCSGEAVENSIITEDASNESVSRIPTIADTPTT